MAFSKVILNGTPLIDLTQDTVSTDSLMTSYTAHNAAGQAITGTAVAGSGGNIQLTQDQNGYIILPEEGSGGGSIPEITISTSGSVTQELQPNTVYHFTSEALTSLTITLGSVSSTAQYHFDFISPETPVVLTLPQTVSMSNLFSVEPNTRYEIDIVDNYGVFAEWVYEVTE